MRHTGQDMVAEHTGEHEVRVLEQTLLSPLSQASLCSTFGEEPHSAKERLDLCMQGSILGMRIDP
jgi:hypothetical protein